MNEGRPILTQAVAPPSSAPVSRESVRIRNLYRKLMLSGFAEQPFIEDQADLLPDTVKVVSRKAVVLDLSNAEDLERYSVLMTDTKKKGREVIVFEEHKSFEALGTWKVFLKTEVRAFKCLTNSAEARLLIEAIQEDTDPTPPLEEEPEDDLDPEGEEGQDTREPAGVEPPPEPTAIDP